MNRALRIFAILAAVAALGGPASAHHGSSVAYDVTKPLVFHATVTQFLWSNPHCQIYFDAKDSRGRIVNWGSETNAPSTLAKAGWTKDTLKPGDRIAITVFPSKDGYHYGLLSKIVLANGRTLLPVSPEDAAKRRQIP